MASRGYLGFNIKVLIETGEEVGSIGLREICEVNKDRLLADVFIAQMDRALRQRNRLFLWGQEVHLTCYERRSPRGVVTIR
ncbi:MAG: hypothetical protein CM1200mP18_20610 [Gammaproteobacteria bacterium]|nr:MAG: hypothetical protein CM1200mP18_20610 [Gammaproteobacteria bacterium]